MNVPFDSFDRFAVPRSVRLTPREIEVLSLIAQGYRAKEAGEILFLSKRTVEGHLANVYGKLGVSNRVQAFQTAVRLGLIPHEPTNSLTLYE